LASRRAVSASKERVKFRLGLILGFGAGYYLGAKAGRARYEQMRRVAAKVPSLAKLQAAADLARERFRPSESDGVPPAMVPPSPN
jgi:hypothetical protein